MTEGAGILGLLSLEGFEAQCEKGVKMGVQLQIEQMPGYLSAKFTGAGVAEDVWRQFELIAEHCKRVNKNKLLLNFLEVDAEVSLVDRYNIGEQAQIFARYNIKVAAAEKPERADYERFAEKVARNRWVNIRRFTNVKDAEKWLLE